MNYLWLFLETKLQHLPDVLQGARLGHLMNPALAEVLTLHHYLLKFFLSDFLYYLQFLPVTKGRYQDQQLYLNHQLIDLDLYQL